MSAKKRSRSENFSEKGGAFVDSFLPEFLKTCGKRTSDHDARAALINKVLKAASGRTEELMSESWTFESVRERLKNAARKHNKLNLSASVH